MNESVLDNLKTAYTEYLSTLSIGSLRLVGRHSGVSKSTLKKKGDLIVEIVAVLTGEVPPAEKNNRGAPVKDDYVDPKIFGKLEEIKLTYLASLPAEEGEQAESSLREAGTEPNILDIRSPEFAPEKPAYYKEEVYSGQLETLNGVSCLLPLDGRDSEAERIIVTVSMIKTFDLREGDIVACHAEKHHAALIAGEILSVNGLPVANGARAHFEDLEVCYPKERIFLYREKGGSEAMKYIDWLVPFGKGQRALVTAAPKTGKTTFLKDIAKAITETHPEIRLLVLLTDQSPESVGEFKKIVPKSDLVYTTFDDDAEKHVFMANFLLKRAKRFAEAGMDVLLLVDSLTNLAHAYNETEDSLGSKHLSCGLETKTVHYIRKYFGTARCLERGGSLSMFGTVSVDTGNPMDDLLSCELLSAANSEIVLSNSLAVKRVFPAVDAQFSQTKCSALFSDAEREGEAFIRNQYLPAFGSENFTELIARANSSTQLYKAVANAVKSKKSV